MATNTNKGVPAIPAQALNAITDENVRIVLQNIVDGLHVRNGVSGDGNSRFITAGEIDGLKSNIQQSISSAVKSVNYPESTLTSGQIDKIINDLQASLIESKLWKELGERITLIDNTYSLEVTGLEQELNDAAKQILDLKDGVTDITIIDPETGEITTTRGIKKSADTSKAAIGEINNVSASSTSAAARNIASTAADMTTANANITAINDVSATSTSANARQLAGLQATVLDPATGLAAAHSAITSLNDISATSGSSTARYLFAVNASVGQKNKTFFQSTEPVSDAKYTLLNNDLWFDSDDKNKAYRWNNTTSKWVETSDQRISGTETLVTKEITNRSTTNAAIIKAVETMWAAIGDNSALIQNGQDVLVTRDGAKVSNWDQIQTAIKDPDTGEILKTATVRAEATATSNKLGELEGKYSVKVDLNGYVSGFGIISSENNAKPKSDFIIRADRFGIGSPSSGNLTDALPNAKDYAIPFIVKTTDEKMDDGTVIKAGVYIDTAMIKHLDGSFINAGLLQASKIYTGSQYVDFDSKYDIPAVATSNWITTVTSAQVDANRYIGPITDSSLIFYGPDYHYRTPYNRRIRSATSDNKISFTINATCTADHHLSLWYRNTSNIWTAITFTTEPQDGYGSVSICAGLTLSVPKNGYVQFGIFPTNTTGTWSQWGSPLQKAMKNLTFNITAVNL